jgi:hypothetical protein
MKPPPHSAEEQDGDVVPTQFTSTFFSVEGRVDPLELILHALHESGATGVGRLLDHRPFDGEPRRP